MPGLLAFHAHPDDEVTATGGTLAKYAAAGEQVVVVTATDGAEGEVHNYDNADEVKAHLAEYRAREVAAALEILGVPHHEWLGYRDSGMMGEPSNDHPECFWQASFTEATGKLVHLLRHYRPEVMVIYDPFGGYGHPDHVNVHRVGLAAFHAARDLARYPLDEGDEEWRPRALYWNVWPRSRVAQRARLRHEAGQITPEEYELQSKGGYPDEDVDVWLDVSAHWEQKVAAWRAHRTQIPEEWFSNWLSDGDDPASVFGTEAFVRIAGPSGAADDLFAGLR
jgi:N-acetyl-1-D-myo-inositol-2-amino-2-deoxy-alpha-D-glucopyranoside deacetylase